MNTRYPFLALGIIGFSLAASAAYAKGLSTQDFVTKASIANQFEIKSSEMALEKTGRDDIKSFAQQMVDDHTKASEKLEETLSSSNSKVTPAEKLDSKHQKLMDKLESISGDDFDRQYILIQTDAHKEAVNLFSKYSKDGKDSALKRFASDTLPTLEQHRDHIQRLNVNQ